MTGELYFPDLFGGRLKGGETTSRVDRLLGRGGVSWTIFIDIFLVGAIEKKSGLQ